MIPRALAAAVLAAAVAACSLAPSPPTASPSRAAQEALVAAYLSALKAGDEQAILDMVTPGVDARRDVEAALAGFGGAQIHDPRVTGWLDDFGGSYVRATVTATGPDGSPVTIVVPVSRVGDRYYIALGQAASPGATSAPQSPSS